MRNQEAMYYSVHLWCPDKFNTREGDYGDWTIYDDAEFIALKDKFREWFVERDTSAVVFVNGFYEREAFSVEGVEAIVRGLPMPPRPSVDIERYNTDTSSRYEVHKWDAGRMRVLRSLRTDTSETAHCIVHKWESNEPLFEFPEI